QPAIEQIENARQQNKKQCQADVPGKILSPGIGLDNFGERHEAAKKIPCRHQVRQKKNLQLRIHRAALNFVGFRFHYSKDATMVSPPLTLSPSLATIFTVIGKYKSHREPYWIRL